MKGTKLLTLSLLMVSLFCFFAVSASADDQSGKQGSTQLLGAVEDPGNSGPPHNDDGAVGNPSHDDDWALKDKPNNGAWGKGKNSGEGTTSSGVDIWTMLLVVSSL